MLSKLGGALFVISHLSGGNIKPSMSARVWGPLCLTHVLVFPDAPHTRAFSVHRVIVHVSCFCM